MARDIIDEIDGLDLRIIDVLQDDSRLSFHKVAAKTKISVGTAYNRIRKLEAKGYLKKYTVIIDPIKLGYEITAIIFVQAEGACLRDLRTKLPKPQTL